MLDTVACDELDVPPLARGARLAFEHSLTDAMGSVAPLSECVVLAGLVGKHELGDGHFPNERSTLLEGVTHLRDRGRLVTSGDA